MERICALNCREVVCSFDNKSNCHLYFTSTLRSHTARVKPRPSWCSLNAHWFLAPSIRSRNSWLARPSRPWCAEPAALTNRSSTCECKGREEEGEEEKGGWGWQKWGKRSLFLGTNWHIWPLCVWRGKNYNWARLVGGFHFTSTYFLFANPPHFPFLTQWVMILAVDDDAAAIFALLVNAVIQSRWINV